MKASIFISGRITKGETLIDVVRQFKSFDNPTEIYVEINSNGGNKEEGEAVYNYLQNLELPITTKAVKAYSIAAYIFAAGDVRIVDDKDQVLGVHFARVTPKGTFTAEEIEVIAEEMRSIKKEFINFYSDHLNIDKTTVENILENETIMNGAEAVDLGFATMIEEKAEIIAELNIDHSKSSKMNKDEKKQSLFKKIVTEFTAFLEGAEISAELVLQDSTGTEIKFPDLDSTDTPKVGDSATIDGSAIPDGSYIMPSLDESTVMFEGGKITEITPKEETTETEPETEVTAEEIKEVVTWSANSSNTSFNEGETLMLEGYSDEMEDYAASAGEWKLKDGRSIVTDASGVIVKVKDAEAEQTEAPTTETEAELKPDINKMVSEALKGFKAEVSAEFESKLAEKDAEIRDLKSKQGSKEYEAEQRETPRLGKNTESKAAHYLRSAGL